MNIQLKYIQDTLAFISNKGYEISNHEFLKSTAVFLTELFNVNYVLIDKYSLKKPSISETVVFYGNGVLMPNVVYKLANTPCEMIINKKLCTYPTIVRAIFPKDDFLAQNNIDSYIGIPLWNSKKEPIGLIALMDNKPLREIENIEIILKIISFSVEKALESILYKEEINSNIKELNTAKEVAEEREKKLMEVQKIANIGTYALDISLGFWESSAVLNAIFGIDEDYVKDVDGWLKIIHPKYRENIGTYFRTNVLKDHEFFNKQYQIIKVNDRQEKWVHGYGKLEFNEKGNPIKMIGTIQDITAQKKLELKNTEAKEIAEKSEEKFKKLSNLTFEGILIHEKSIVIDCNTSFLKMFGYNLEDLVGKDITKIIYPENYHKIIVENSTKKKTHPYEAEGIRKDGSIFPIEIEARNIATNNNKFLRVTAFRDINERKKSEAENKKLSIVVEQSANSIVITDLKGNIEYTNSKFTKITGYAAAEVLGKNPRILSSGKQPKEFYSNLWQTITAGKIWNGEFQNKAKNGNLYWERTTITPIKNEAGEISSYLAIKEDISKKKEAEEKLQKAAEEIEKSEKKFRELFEKSGDAILIIKNGVFTDCNQAALDLLGYKKFKDVLNSLPSRLSPKFQPDGSNSAEKAEALIKTALKKGTHRFEWWHTKSNGEIFPVEVLLTTIENEPINQVIHCVWRDITQRKKADEQLQKQNEEYRTLSEEYFTQNTALQQLSHELSEKNRLLLESKDRFINLFGQNPVPLWEQDFSGAIKLLNKKKTETNDLKIYLNENFDFLEECIANIKILNANNAALELFGVKNVAELKMHLAKTNSVRALEVLKNELESIGSNNKTFSDETELTGKDGSTILALIKSVIIDDYGTSIASVIDITPLINAKNELDESQYLLLESQKIANIGSYVLDFSTGIWKSSPALNDIFGIDENYGRNVKSWLGLVHPEDLNMMKRYFEKNIVENRELFNKDYRIIRKSDKQVRWVHGMGKLEFDENGNLKRMIGTIQDISEKRQILHDIIIAKEKAEESENNLKERVKELQGIYSLHQLTEKNIDSDIVYEELINNIIPKSMQFTDKVYCEMEINNKIYSNNKNYKVSAGKNYLSQRIRVNEKQVGELKVAYTDDLPFVEIYEPNLIETYARKISVFLDRKDLFEKLIYSKEKAEESGRLKTEFIQNMSHEIRTPMNGILGFSELLDNPDLTEEKRKRFIEIIKNSSHQLLHIIDDLMEISVLETKQIKAEEHPVCINDLLLELHTIFNIKATINKIELVLTNELLDQESTILTDKNKLNKVLNNLLENALKFTDEGIVELGYKLNNDTKPAELEIFVKDSGIGIGPEKQIMIFERFSQAEKALSKKVGGLGLGLSIAKENAELLGGKISVVSQLGEGATFFVTIPYKPVNMVTKVENEIEKEVDNKKKHTILIAEDEEVNFMVLEILLMDKLKLPYTIIYAKDGLEAVELCKNIPEIDLVLMDIKMPKMDGHEATKIIKKIRPNLPIIAQTAFSSPEEREKAFLSGCDDFMAKPISKDALTAVINNYLLAD